MSRSVKIADHAVEFAAVISIAAVAHSPTQQPVALAAAISSVAVGKRYLSSGGNS